MADIESLSTKAMVAVGVLFFGVGLLMVMIPGVAAGLPFGNGTIMAIGGIALLLAGIGIRARWRGEIVETEIPNPERPQRVPIPGDDIDRKLYEMSVLRQGIDENRDELESRLRALAISAIRSREDCSVGEASELLDSGRWTEDETAQAFFQNSTEDGSTEGLARMIGGEQRDFEGEFRATVDALAEYTEIQEQRDVQDEEGGFRQRFKGRSVESNWNVEDSSIPSFNTDEPFEDVSVRETNRWLGVTAFGLVALGVGIIAFNPGLMLAGTVGIGYTIYGRINAIPPTRSLTVERELSEDSAEPGDVIDVTVTIHNEGDAMLPNLRLVDIVPDPCVVTDGSPRVHTALKSGAQVSFTYSIKVERGEFRWPLLAVARDFSGGVERTSLLTPSTTLSVHPSLEVRHTVPVRTQTTMYSGDVATSSGGSGLEFHSVREYRLGDPMKRINWKAVARSGELATIDFRQERAVKVTLLFDTRQRAYVSAGPEEPHAVDRSVYAASEIFGALFEAGNLVGVAAFDTVPCWYPPGAGDGHRERARRLFAEHPALSSTPPERQDIEGGYIDPMTHVRRRLSSNSQIFLFTPLVDDYPAEVARRLDSAGHRVTVISPETTAMGTVGQRLTTIERIARIRYLRERGVRVVDWRPEERIELRLQKARTRWAQ